MGTVVHSKEFCAQIRDAFEGGMPTKEIGFRYGIHRSCVNRILAKFGIRSVRASRINEHKKAIIRLYGAGLNIKEIAKNLKIPTTTMFGWCRSMGLVLKTNRTDDPLGMTDEESKRIDLAAHVYRLTTLGSRDAGAIADMLGSEAETVQAIIDGKPDWWDRESAIHQHEYKINVERTVNFKEGETNVAI